MTDHSRRFALFKIRNTLVATTALGALGTLFPSPALAQSSRNKKKGPPVLWMGGLDPVSYFVYGFPLIGKTGNRWIEEKTNIEYRFINNHTRDIFRANKGKAHKKFLPRYGGNCAYAMSLGYKFRPDITQFEIYEDRLYLFYNFSARRLWRMRPEEHIANASENWKEKFNSGKPPKDSDKKL